MLHCKLLWCEREWGENKHVQSRGVREGGNDKNQKSEEQSVRCKSVWGLSPRQSYSSSKNMTEKEQKRGIAMEENSVRRANLVLVSFSAGFEKA